MRPTSKPPAAAVLMMVAVLPLLFAAPDFPGFPDVANQVGLRLMNVTGSRVKDYIIEVNGNGAGFFDYDGDGDQDVLIANGSTLEAFRRGGDLMAALYRNDDGRFTDVTAEARLGSRGWGMGVCVADYDNDGYKDFYVTAYGPNVLYRNNGDGTFANRSLAAGVGNQGWGTNCAFGDYDRDGDLDLYVVNYLRFNELDIPRRGETNLCRYLGIDVFCGPRGVAAESDVLYRNEGNGTFTDVSVAAGVAARAMSGFGVVFSDFDNDGWLDIYVANDMMPNLLYHNLRDGGFSEVGLLSGAALNGEGREQAGMGIGVGDYDGNGLFDIFVTNFARDTNTLYQNLGSMLFEDVTSRARLGEASFYHLGWGTGFADFDNDGWEDIFVANGHVYPEIDGLQTRDRYHQPKEVYRNAGDGRFEAITPDLDGDLLVPKSARGTAFCDYDNDGDIDILVTNLNDRPNLYRNEGGNARHWINLSLEGTRSNRDAIGARVEITAGGRTRVAEVRAGGSYLSHNDTRLHFGLGELRVVDLVRIRWPNGQVQELGPLEGDQFWTIREREGPTRARSGER